MAALTALGLVVAVRVLATRDDRRDAAAAAAAEVTPGAPGASGASGASRPPAPLPRPSLPAAAPPTPRPPPAPAATTEAMLMARLRALGGTDPALSLRLARDGNALFPDGPDAAERSWTIAKSLADLGRFEEAVAEARAMVARFPGNDFALDVQRHLLSNPLGLDAAR